MSLLMLLLVPLLGQLCQGGSTLEFQPDDALRLSKSIFVALPETAEKANEKIGEPEVVAGSSSLALTGPNLSDDDDNNNNNSDDVEADADGPSRATAAHSTRGRLEGSVGDEQLVQMGQFDEPMNSRNKVDVSLYQLANSSQPPPGAGPQRDQQLLLPVVELNQEFLSLFDELWRFKNTTVTALTRLDYFNSTKEPAPEETDRGPPQPDLRPPSEMGPVNRLGLIWPKSDGKLLTVRKQLQRQTPLPVSLNKAAGKIQGWFSRANERIRQMAGGLIRQLNERLAVSVLDGGGLVKTSHTTKVLDPRNQEPAVGTSQFRSSQGTQPEPSPALRSLLKRSPEDSARGEPPTTDCVNLTIDETAQCYTTEAEVNAKLNISFPGTVKSIEENCGSITFLLTSCWPHQLQVIRSSMKSWNESLLAMTEFPLPLGQQSASTSSVPSSLQAPRGTQLQGTTTQTSCGVQSKAPQVIQDRVTWMWVNLCLDKRFRQDYVDNILCLAYWNQERAQRTCKAEYSRLQTHLSRPVELEALVSSSTPTDSMAIKLNRAGPNGSAELLAERLVSFNTDHLASHTTGIPNGGPTNRLERHPETELEREISSKTMCCVFDEFLRCVYNKAARDCGRPGGQLVVDFMSRIGTDDMKYMCNGETRANTGTRMRFGNNQRLRATSANGAPDKHPFIESNYCADPKIQVAIHGSSASQMGDRGRNPTVGYTGNRQTGVNRAKGRPQVAPGNQVSHDPTFFGVDIVVKNGQNGCSSRSLTTVGHLQLLASILIAMTFGMAQ